MLSIRRCRALACLLAPAIWLTLSSPAHATTVAINDPASTGPVEPVEFGPAEESLTDYIQHIKWSGWGGPTASGEGGVMTSHTEASITSPVKILLSGLTTCVGFPIYTQYSLTVAPGAPVGVNWSRWQHGTYPCDLLASGYRPGEGGKAAAGGCLSLRAGSWTPRRAPSMCRAKWANFGTSPVAVGKGVARGDEEDWAGEFTFSDVEWCHTGSSNDALSYTQMSITTYGNPIPAGRHPPEIRGEDPYNVSEREADRLRARIGRPGFKRKSYRHVGPIERGCQPLMG